MADIAPIQMDAQGVVTFEKQEVQEVKVPMTDAEAKAVSPSKGHNCQDQVSFSRPMKKHLHKKKSYFQKPTKTPEQLAQEQLKAQAQPTDVSRINLMA